MPFNFARDRLRRYLRCPLCELVFVPPEYHLSPDAERERYELHDSSAANAGYVDYLWECVNVVSRLVLPGTRVLDFGCGKHAVLTGLLRRRGFVAEGYDPLYGIGVESFGSGSADAAFGVVVLWEVVEHLRNPREEFLRVKKILRPDGTVVVRTGLYDDTTDFRLWWYAMDPTHICFMSRQSIEKTADLLERRLSFHDNEKTMILQV